MEGSGYGSAHLPSPALVVFSQAAGGLSEALRIQRPFHSQLQDAKDLHHLSLVGSYGAHLLHGFPPHFLHPAVSSANTSGGPFSGGGAFVKPFPSSLPLPSAFAPPKCVGGLEQNMLFSGNESFRTDSSSPACTSLSPPVKEESLEGHTSEEGDRDRICSPDRSPEAPGFRRMPVKKQSIGTPPPNTCPVCGIQLNVNELEAHFLTELDRLYKLSNGSERQRLRANFNMTSGMHPTNGMLQGPDSRWETFQRIRTNRQGRLRAKTRKRKSDSESEFTEQLRNSQCQSCPVCHGRLQRTPEEISQHVEECIRKNGQRREEEDETVDVESYGDETSNTAVNLVSQNNNNSKIESAQSSPTTHIRGEEQMITSVTNPWDRKHRIPMIISNNNNNCVGTPMTNVSRATPTSSDQISEYEEQNRDKTQDLENEEELIVDNTDDEDCVKKSRNCDKITSKNSSEEATSSMEIDSVSPTESNAHKVIAPTPDSYVSTSEPAEPTSRAQVLEELRARIRELEGSPFKVRSSQDEENYKCYICKESYSSPVISTNCWHVHCNDCWITLSGVLFDPATKRQEFKETTSVTLLLYDAYYCTIIVEADDFSL
ncbi:hypothetical protein HA402_004934 [Bradysia odoriphaga]|nr:hypothetical protein HA402_004934 [Bradysia odoriphaga]